MNFLYKVYHRFLSPHIECARLYRLDLTKYEVKINYAAFDNFVFEMPDVSCFEQLIEHYQNKASKLQIISNRFSSGNYLCFAFRDTSSNKIAYTRWICKNSYYSETLRQELKFQENEVLTLDSWTHPDYRGLGLHRKMNIEMLNWLKQNTDTKTVFMIIKCFIPHLTKIPKELGYKPIKTHLHFTKTLL